MFTCIFCEHEFINKEDLVKHLEFYRSLLIYTDNITDYDREIEKLNANQSTS